MKPWKAKYNNPDIPDMKTNSQAKLFAISAAIAFSVSSAFAQTKLIINGAKMNMDTAVVLSVNDLTINNSTLKVSESKLKVAGAITSASGLDASNGTVEMNGTANQQIPANTFASNIIKYMVLNSGAQVSVLGTLGLTDILTLTAGNFAGGGYFALKSTASKTARVAPVDDNAVIATSDIVVERFIPAKRAYRFLTAPVNTPGDIKSNWMENSNNVYSGININPNPGYGTHISGLGNNTNGFDATNTSNPSMYTYNNSSQSWVRIPNTFAQMHTGEPFRIMIRGDRSTDLTINNPWPSNTTLRAKGALATKTIIFSKPGGSGTSGMQTLSAAVSGYSFIGNPYASAIDWNQLERSDITGTMYIFDPTLSGSNGRGAYVAYNSNTGINNISSSVDNNIQSGQAFFIKNSGANPLLTIRETHKTGEHRAVFRTSNTTPRISLQLLLPGQDSTGQSADGVSAYFSDNFDNGLGDEDSYKYTNPDENLSIIRSDSSLSIEGRKTVNVSDTLPLKISQMSPKDYMFKSIISNFDPAVTAYLEDKYLQTVTILNNNSETLVPFTVSTDSLSFVKDRFRIVFRGAGTLPLTFSSVKAYEKNKNIQVDWTIATELNINKYEVEKSSNAVQFTSVGEVKAKNTQLSMYGLLDEKPFNGDNYYRIKSISNSGDTKHSAIVKVYITTQNEISIIANAITQNTINAQFKNAPAGNYHITIVSSNGQKVYAGNVTHAAGSTETINLNNLLAAGIYHLQVLIDGKVYSTAILIK